MQRKRLDMGMRLYISTMGTMLVVVASRVRFTAGNIVAVASVAQME